MSLQLKRWIACALALAVIGTAVSVCSADGKNKRPPMDPAGEPEGHLKKGTTECYKVWHNEDGWHIRVVNGKGTKDHRYQGTIIVEDGVMEQVSSHLAKKNGAENVWKHGPKKQEVSFDFATFEKEDGINFKASKFARTVQFTLKIDGRDVPEQICVGKRGDHPDSSTFVLDAHPGDKREVKEVKRDARESVKEAKQDARGAVKEAKQNPRGASKK